MRLSQGTDNRTPIGIVTMWARGTKLEFIIVSIALLVLLMCSRPPKSGNADVGKFHEQALRPISSTEQLVPESNPDGHDGRAEEGLMDVASEAPLPTQGSDDALVAPPAPRIAAVDARGCNRLDYQDVMYGQVTVRWVWNGTKFVPHKVCVVEEEGGVSSVWSFDQQEEASLSELSPGED